jgi:uncharacterized protein (DUF433 family)
VNLQDRIVLDLAIHDGRRIIRGTRLPISLVVGSLAGGMTFEEIQREYDITPEDIRAALRYVTQFLGQELAQPAVHGSRVRA